ncbi:thioesterase family protein [Aestuariivita sp.]|jgi:4-hydroxybenzoyl-CoA thioesterase|uniref:acyl-CoA thioesterase n=1 Tax=Aestuariivita sp. TaxID=1872407 RepID=UPI00216F05F1|nr:thioesterase family protein [Aestuariivita sp.]MCE8005597.1 acyl-CoA thioesterase [Aestuariivita sp.]
MAFIYRQKVKFKHCDPAGIVFYPRYFEMTNDTVEAFFEEVLGFSFAQVQAENGVPTAQIEATFAAPSRLGDDLEITLDIQRVGRSSLTVGYACHCADELRFRAQSTLVLTDRAGTSTPWPDALREILQSLVTDAPGRAVG